MSAALAFVLFALLPLQREEEFDLLDKNKDKRISPEEFAQWIFYRVDAGRDGFVDAEEIKNFRFGDGNKGELKIPAKFFKERDKDGDGKLGREEFAVPPKFFENWDKNKDGFLDEKELYRGGGPKQPKDPGNLTPADFIKKADKNNDGAIDKQEWAAVQREQLFDRADKNGDGKLTLDELTHAFVELRREGFLPSPDGFVERFDLDGDKKVTRREFPGTDEMFKRLDENGDGVITTADVFSAEKKKS